MALRCHCFPNLFSAPPVIPYRTVPVQRQPPGLLPSLLPAVAGALGSCSPPWDRLWRVFILLSKPSRDAFAARPGSLSCHLALLVSNANRPCSHLSLYLLVLAPVSSENASLVADCASLQISQESQYYLSCAWLLE